MKAFIRVMKALSEPNRIKILKMLETRELCVCEIQAALGLAQPTVSKHLQMLENAGLVRSHKVGVWVNYRLQDAPSTPFATAILADLPSWLNDEDDITQLRSRLPRIRRETILKKC